MKLNATWNTLHRDFISIKISTIDDKIKRSGYLKTSTFYNTSNQYNEHKKFVIIIDALSLYARDIAECRR